MTMKKAGLARGEKPRGGQKGCGGRQLKERPWYRVLEGGDGS